MASFVMRYAVQTLSRGLSDDMIGDLANQFAKASTIQDVCTGPPLIDRVPAFATNAGK